MSKCVQLKDLVFLIVTVPKIFKIGQKLTEIWPKNRFFGGLGTFCANFTKMVLWVLSALTFSYIYIYIYICIYMYIYMRM